MLTRLIVLGLLKRRPMHGYEIQQILQLGHVDRWTGILPGSIYHALKRLEQEGLVQVESVEQTGHRTRAIYKITESGLTEHRKLLQEAWRTPATALPSTLYVAMTFLDDLPREEMLAAVTAQIAELEQRLAELNLGEGAKADHSPVPEYLRMVFANNRAHLEADLQLLRYLQQTLPTTPERPLGELPTIDEEESQ
jgi:DNA-binding PadR family transcriptional regulator